MSLTKTLLVAAAVALGGCYATVGPPGVAVEGEYGYIPEYYEGNVVYYDNLGSPYYVVEGRPFYVPRSYPRYHAYVEHYRVHRGGYDHWYGRNRPVYHERYRATRPRYQRRR